MQPIRTAAVLGTGSDVMSIRGRPVADEVDR